MKGKRTRLETLCILLAGLVLIAVGIFRIFSDSKSPLFFVLIALPVAVIGYFYLKGKL